jgi:amino acid adenylation domain-containing protein
LEGNTRTSGRSDGPAGEAETNRLAFSQQRLWFQEQLAPGSAAYHIHLPFALRGPVDIDALRFALGEIVRRNEVLRTTFGERHGQPVARVQPPYDPLEVLDVSDDPDPDAVARTIVADESARPFDLAKGPLVRVHLVRTGDERSVLLFVIHHIVFDWFSERVMGEELSRLYAMAVDGHRPVGSADGAGYRDYIAWQRTPAYAKELEAKLGYWTKALADLGEALELHPDRPRPAVLSFEGGSRSVTIGATTTERLRRIARDERSTLFATLLSGFSAFLARYTGREDIVVGTPTAGRTRRELQDVIGCFVNVAPMRTACPPDSTLAGLAKVTRRTVLGAVANQNVPFERLVEAAAPERSANRNPLFQITFESRPERTAEIAIRLPDVVVTPLEVEVVGTRFDLEVTVRESAETLECTAVYSTELFDPGTIEAFLAGLTTFLDAAAAGPDRAIADLPMVPSTARARLAGRPAATPASAAPGDTVVAMVRDALERSPSAVAVDEGDRQLTYGELDERSRRIAHAVSAGAGAGADDIVGVCLPRGADLVAALLGVLRAGAAYLPLDPAEPPDRLAAMVEDAGCRAVVAGAEGARAVPAGVAVIDPRDGRDDGGDRPEPDPSHLAYVIFTSGSTGRPKGVAVEHAGLANLVRWQRREYRLDPSVRASQLAPIGFDAAVWEIWPVLSAGATLVVGEPDLAALDRWLADQRIDLAFVVTPVAEMLFGRAPTMALSRPMLVGGSRLTRRPPPGVAVVNHYGPTEATVVATSSPVASDGVGEPDIGRPIDNVAVYVLDERQQPLPVGAVGEIVIGGAGVARGYLADPVLTAARFPADPFRPGRRMYRTGDLGRVRSDGAIQFVGRTDDQVKVRGHRVELGEVETVVRAHPDVDQVAVVALDDPAVGVELVAHVVPVAALREPAGPVVPDDVRSFVEARLPGPLVPSRFLAATALPVDHRGKVDRARLGALSARDQEPPDAGDQALTGTERRVGEVWASALGVTRVEADDDFFDLGGQSLVAAEMVATLRAELGLDLPLRTIFEAPTLAEFAEALDDLAGRGVPGRPERTT